MLLGDLARMDGVDQDSQDALGGRLFRRRDEELLRAGDVFTNREHGLEAEFALQLLVEDVPDITRDLAGEVHVTTVGWERGDPLECDDDDGTRGVKCTPA